MDDKEIIRGVITAGIIAILASTIRMLMAKQETTMQRVRNFVAGVFMGLLLGYILRYYENHLVKEVAIGLLSAFISSVWPILENFVVRITKKKTNDIVNDSHIGEDIDDN